MGRELRHYEGEDKPARAVDLKVGADMLDIVAVTRHNRTLEMGNYRKAADDGGFFLRGFNYLLLLRKKKDKDRGAPSPG